MKLTIEEIQEIETDIIREVAVICNNYNIKYFAHCGTVLGAIRHGGPIPWDTDADIIVPYDQYDKFIKTIRENLSAKFYLDYYDINKFYPSRFARIGLTGYSTHILHVDIFKLVGISESNSKQYKLHKMAKKLRKIMTYKTYRKEYFGSIRFKTQLSLLLHRLVYLGYNLDEINFKYKDLYEKYSFENSLFVTNLDGHYGMKNVLLKSIYGKGILVNYADFKVRIPEQYEEYLKNYYGDYMKLPPENERTVKDFYEISKMENL